jgi:DNA-binding response OmpR family regulator
VAAGSAGSWRRYIMIFLIIDKAKRWADYVKMVLEEKNHQVKILTEYEKALESTREDNFDLIFCDSKSYKKNRKFLCELIMQSKNNRVIVVSALPNYKDAMYAKLHGAVDYIDKLYDPDELIKIINKNIKSTPINREYLKRVFREEEELCV